MWDSMTAETGCLAYEFTSSVLFLEGRDPPWASFGAELKKQAGSVKQQLSPALYAPPDITATIN